jgi:Rod binding domain-containing protein
MQLAAPLPPVEALRPAPRLEVPSRSATPEQMRNTAEEFEVSFLAAMLQPVFAALPTDGPFGGGEGEATFRSFMVEAMARQAVRAGGIGLADRVQAEMLKLQEGRR